MTPTATTTARGATDLDLAEQAPAADAVRVEPAAAPDGNALPVRVARVALATVLALLMGGVSFWLFTRNNDFPIHYHPDEGTKVAQLMSTPQERNVYHPLLMLEAAHLAIRAFEVDQDNSRDVVRAGRATSAGLASLGVVALALAAFVGYGFVGLAVAGSAAMLCPPLLVYAHYLKEDASLAGGIALSILGARLVLSARSAWTQLPAAIALGIGCAAAVSGKAVGAAVLVPAVLAILIAAVPRWWAVPLRIVLFVAVFVASTVAINARAFEDPWNLDLSRRAQANLNYELEHGRVGHNNLTLTKPNRFCVSVALSELQPHVWALAAVGAVGLAWMTLRRRWVFTRWGLVLGLYLAAFVAVLSYNAIPFGRYALPISFLAYYVAASLASAGIAGVASMMRRPRLMAAGAAAVCTLVVCAFQGTRCLNFNRQFADDSRQRLREWIATHLPPYSPIVSDYYAQLNGGGDPWRFPNQATLRQNVNGSRYASLNGTLEDLARRGVRYVVTAEPDYSRFFAVDIRAEDGYDEWLKQQQRFYVDLFAKGKLLWSSTPDPPSHAYVNPELRVYQIDHLKPPPNPNRPLTPAERYLRQMEERRRQQQR